MSLCLLLTDVAWRVSVIPPELQPWCTLQHGGIVIHQAPSSLCQRQTPRWTTYVTTFWGNYVTKFWGNYVTTFWGNYVTCNLVYGKTTLSPNYKLPCIKLWIKIWRIKNNLRHVIFFIAIACINVIKRV